MSVHGTELRVVILGAEKTGKTALVNKYIHSSSRAGQNSSPDQDQRKHLTLDGQTFTLNLVTAETSGDNYLFQSGHAFILLYAINDKTSFTHIWRRHNQLKEAKGPRLSSTPIFLVGAKADLEAERQVSLEEARQFAIELRCQKLFEISALNQGPEINDLFSKLVRQYLTFQQPPPSARPPMTPIASAPRAVTSPPASPANDESPRRGSVLERLKFGSLKRKGSVSSLMRKKSGSFSESLMSLGSARPSRDNVRSVSYNAASTQSEAPSTVNNYSKSYYNNVTVPRKSSAGSPFRLDVNTSAWRDTIKWPSEIIPEEDLLAK